MQGAARAVGSPVGPRYWGRQEAAAPEEVEALGARVDGGAPPLLHVLPELLRYVRRQRGCHKGGGAKGIRQRCAPHGTLIHAAIGCQEEQVGQQRGDADGPTLRAARRDVVARQQLLQHAALLVRVRADEAAQQRAPLGGVRHAARLHSSSPPKQAYTSTWSLGCPGCTLAHKQTTRLAARMAGAAQHDSNPRR